MSVASVSCTPGSVLRMVGHADSKRVGASTHVLSSPHRTPSGTARSLVNNTGKIANGDNDSYRKTPEARRRYIIITFEEERIRPGVRDLVFEETDKRDVPGSNSAVTGRSDFGARSCFSDFRICEARVHPGTSPLALITAQFASIGHCH
ncbi:hypothetical protein J6590_005918 [Homalodisca vitripennis]|nr:hypothetical protein J6590_005918 [Homalodisca vitripennis]